MNTVGCFYFVQWFSAWVVFFDCLVDVQGVERLRQTKLGRDVTELKST